MLHCVYIYCIHAHVTSCAHVMSCVQMLHHITYVHTNVTSCAQVTCLHVTSYVQKLQHVHTYMYSVLKCLDELVQNLHMLQHVYILQHVYMSLVGLQGQTGNRPSRSWKQLLRWNSSRTHSLLTDAPALRATKAAQLVGFSRGSNTKSLNICTVRREYIRSSQKELSP